MSGGDLPLVLAGAVGGIVVLSFGLAAVDAAPSYAVSTTDSATLIAGFGGAVIGSAISALMSWLLLRQTSKETLRRDSEARDRESEAAALRLMVKSSLILSDVAAIRKTIDSSLLEANDRQITDQPVWTRVLPIVGAEKKLTLEADDMAPLFELKEHELIYSATDLFQLQPVLISAINLFNRKREEARSISDAHSVGGDGIVNTEYTQAQYRRLLPIHIELEALIKEIRDLIPIVETKAETVTFGIGPAMRKRTGSKFPIFSRKTDAVSKT